MVIVHSHCLTVHQEPLQRLNRHLILPTAYDMDAIVVTLLLQMEKLRPEEYINLSLFTRLVGDRLLHWPLVRPHFLTQCPQFCGALSGAAGITEEVRQQICCRVRRVLSVGSKDIIPWAGTAVRAGSVSRTSTLLGWLSQGWLTLGEPWR